MENKEIIIKEITQRIWVEAGTISYNDAEYEARKIVASWED